MRIKTPPPQRLLDASRLALLTLAAALLPVAGCDSPAGPGSEEGALDAAVMVSANVIGTPIDILVIEITGPGIATPLVYNLEVVDGVASGTLRMPAGPDRLFDVKAYDDINEVTHEGSVTIDVKRGSNPPVELPLVPRSGHVPITITMGDYIVTVDPSSETVLAGQVVALTATVQYPDGSVVTDAVVSWATLNPSIATVDATGNVTAVSAGVVTIVAAYDGIGGASVITVQELLGPVYPPPGGVTLAETGTGIGTGTGLTWSYSGFDLTQSEAMVWGQDTRHTVHIALDGAVDEAGEILAFDPALSNLDGGVLVWTGQTQMNVWDGTAFVETAVPTRVTATVSEVSGTGATPKALLDAAFIGLPEIGGVALIESAYDAGTTLDVHVLAEAQYAGTWEPAVDLYNRLSTDGSGTQTSFGGAFYYIPPPSP